MYKKDGKNFCCQKSKTELSVAIRCYINENYKRNPSLKEIANAMFVSVSTVCHTFKSDFGLSIKKYLMKKQMGEAARLIKKGESPKKICEKLGFGNYTTFYRNYKKYFGVAPSEKE